MACWPIALWARVDATCDVAAVVELQGVTKSYGPVRALLGVSWRFSQGRITVIQGPNGSGKSTLLAIVGTLTRPTSGKVDHGELGAHREQVRRTLGWLGHESLCYPDLTGRENIALAAQLVGLEAKTAVAKAAERFDLGAFLGRPVRSYSRGQRQRIALARALLHSPRLLLLDEPTTGLDRQSTDRLIDVLRDEAGRGAIVVVVTHDAPFAQSIADDTLALDRGRSIKG